MFGYRKLNLSDQKMISKLILISKVITFELFMKRVLNAKSKLKSNMYFKKIWLLFLTLGRFPNEIRNCACADGRWWYFHHTGNYSSLLLHRQGSVIIEKLSYLWINEIFGQAVHVQLTSDSTSNKDEIYSIATIIKVF